MEELSFRFRVATVDDLPQVRHIGGPSLAHPDGQARPASYGSAAQRGELLLLERYDSRTRDWKASAFVDWHMRVDDVLTIRDIGTEGDAPHSGMVKQLLMELLRSLAPIEVTVKARSDASDWNEILRSIAGFDLEFPPEYRRPYWLNVWKWSRESAARAERAARGARRR